MAASGERLRQVADRVGEWVERGEAAAAVAVGLHRGEVVFREAFGRLAPGPDAPRVQVDTIFPIASLSKPIAATAVLAMVEDGRLGLNRPVREYIPELRGEGKDAVLVHHLLTHTAGISEGQLLKHVLAKRDAGELPPTPDLRSIRAFPPYVGYALFDHVLDFPLARPAGAAVEYSSFGYSLLGEIVARVAGKPFVDVVQQRVFEPLGMRDSYCEVPEAQWHRVVRRDPNGPAPHLNVRERLEHAVPQGGVSSTADDLARFAQAFLDGGRPILSRASVAAMTRNQVAGLDVVAGATRRPNASWGLGWRTCGEPGRPDAPALHPPRAFEHGGLGGSYVWVNPDDGIVGVYLSVATRAGRGGAPVSNQDLFADMLTAALTA